MGRPKDVNPPSPWNMRIWDEEEKEWLGESDPNSVAYYGFDIRGGEVTVFQSMDWVYKQTWAGRKLVWERSTGLKDKNGDKEIYEGDIVKELMYVLEGKEYITTWVVRWNNDKFCYELHRISGEPYGDSMLSTCEGDQCEVIGNIHESNMEELCPKE